MELPLFDEVGEVLRGLLPPELGEPHCRHHRYGLKVWFGSEKPTREHYEAQVIGAKHVPEATTLAIEVGFHAEHRDPAANERALARLRAEDRRWRKALGAEPVAGPFIDDRHGWQRLSETWADPDLGDPDLPFELAARLTDYITALEPLRARLTGGWRDGAAGETLTHGSRSAGDADVAVEAWRHWHRHWGRGSQTAGRTTSLGDHSCASRGCSSMPRS